MTANPIELIGGITDTGSVPKADIVGWAKARVPQILADVTEVRNTTLAGQLVIFLKSNGRTYFLDTTDTTTADDGTTCLISSDGKRFKIQSSVPLPTLISLGGVFAIAPVSHKWLKSLGTDGNFTTTQPAAADLSDGLTGTGAVVLATNPVLIGPTLGVALATSVNGLTITTTTGTLTVANGTTLTGPAASDTLLGRASTDTITGVKTFNSAKFALNGSGSGTTVVNASATASGTLTLPAATDTLVGKATTDTLTNKTFDAAGTGNSLANIATSMFATNVVDTDTTLAANSDTRLSSQKAVKSYVDNAITGIKWKASVLCRTTANITLSGEQTLDGQTTSTSRVLVMNQSTASQNGLYVSAAGAWARATDADTAAEITQATVFVQQGTVWGDTQWTCTTDAITLGSTSLVFAQVSGAGTYSAGTGLTLTGNQFAIDSTVVTLTGSQTLTNKTLTSPAITTPTGIVKGDVGLGSVDNTSDATKNAAAVTLTNKTITAPAITGGTHDALTSLGIRSTGAAFDLKLASSEVLTANRTLTVVMGDAARTLTLGASPSVSGSNTGDQTITLTGNVTGSGASSFATTIAANAVTLAMQAQVATATFLGRTTASTGNVEALTVTQATALLNNMVGDSGAGGTKGLVPAPGAGDAAALKVLGAGGTWITQTGGGGGGGMTDSQRQNFLLSTAYQSKSFGGFRRNVNEFYDGYKAADGINAGSSSGYTLDTTNGLVKPTVTTGSDQIPTMTSATTSGVTMSDTSHVSTHVAWNAGDKDTSTYFDTNPASFPCDLTTDFGAGKIITSYTVKTYVPSGTFAPTAWTFDGSPDNSTWTNLNTQSGLSFTAGELKTFTISSPGSYRYYRLHITAGGSSGECIISEITMLTTGATSSMILLTTAQTADATVSNGRVLLEIDNTATPTLNTDLTVEVTCDAGAHWTSASLSSVTVNGQGGRKVVETVDQATTGGTSFGARIKTFNSKLIPIYAATVTVH